MYKAIVIIPSMEYSFPHFVSLIHPNNVYLFSIVFRVYLWRSHTSPHSSMVGTMAEDSTSSTSGFFPGILGERRLPPNFPYCVCQDFWFSDGNVILCAGNFAFKVHRGQLERHADIFQTMLSIPQPDDTGGIIRLCDSPTDVYHLLRALYDGL